MLSAAPHLPLPWFGRGAMRMAAGSVALAGILFSPLAVAEDAGAPRPNIVLIVTDDMGYGDCSSYGATDLLTPFMDGIGRNGVRFTQFRVNPLCAPTRASIMTGLYSLQAGMWRGPGESARGQEPPGGWPADERRIANDIRLLSEFLKEAGYATGTVSHTSAVHFDLFATLLDAAGIPVPALNGGQAVQGISLLPHARSKGATALPDRYLFWDLYGQCGALHGRWKLVGEIGNHHGRFTQAAREAEKTAFALYDLEQDIGEKNDLAARHPDIYADLKQRHLAWLRQFAKSADAVEPATAAPPDSAKKRTKRPRPKEKTSKQPN